MSTYIVQKDERNRRLTRAIRERLGRERLERATRDVVRQVLEGPVDRGFFVSVDHLLVMDRRRREGKLPRMGEETEQMWREIFAAFDDVRNRNAKISRTDAAAQVIARGQASRYFITMENACRILRTQNINVEND